MENLEAIVHEVVLDVARQASAGVTAVNDGDTLTGELGLESLDLAQIVATLEARTALDPFAERVAITSIRTVGDLVAAYRDTRDGVPAADAASLTKARSRARDRRRALQRRRRA